MPARTKQKKVSRAKRKRSVRFEKESWYALAVARFSAARPNLSKEASSR